MSTIVVSSVRLPQPYQMHETRAIHELMRLPYSAPIGELIKMSEECSRSPHASVVDALALVHRAREAGRLRVTDAKTVGWPANRRLHLRHYHSSWLARVPKSAEEQNAAALLGRRSAKKRVQSHCTIFASQEACIQATTVW